MADFDWKTWIEKLEKTKDVKDMQKVIDSLPESLIETGSQLSSITEPQTTSKPLI